MTRLVTHMKSKNPQQPHYELYADFFRDLDWIQTSNLLSRNQVRYSVAPRGLFCGCKYICFYIICQIKCQLI